MVKEADLSRDFIWLLPRQQWLFQCFFCSFFFFLSQWHAFSVPELQNFLVILEKEETERVRSVEQKYAAYRRKLQQALQQHDPWRLTCHWSPIQGETDHLNDDPWRPSELFGDWSRGRAGPPTLRSHTHTYTETFSGPRPSTHCPYTPSPSVKNQGVVGCLIVTRVRCLPTVGRVGFSLPRIQTLLCVSSLRTEWITGVFRDSSAAAATASVTYAWVSLSSSLCT